LRNQKAVVTRGRDPNLLLEDGAGVQQPFAQSALALTQAMEPMARLLDAAHGDSLHLVALQQQIENIKCPAGTPSGKVMAALQASEQSFTEWALRLSRQHRDGSLRGPAPNVNRRNYFRHLAEDSLLSQAKEEGEPQQDFAEYLRNYYAQYPVCTGRLA
jgi:glutamate--cysteine ligase